MKGLWVQQHELPFSAARKQGWVQSLGSGGAELQDPGSETDSLGTQSHRLAPGPGQPSLDRTGLRAPRRAQPSPGAESLLPSAAPRPVGSLTWELFKSCRNPDSALHPAHAQQRHSSWEDGSSAVGVGTHLSTDLNTGSWPLTLAPS